MLRIIFQTVPTGIESLGFETDEIVLGCDLPVRPESQPMTIYWQDRIARVVWQPGMSYLDLAAATIHELKTNATQAEPGALVKGSIALTPEETTARLQDMAAKYSTWIIRAGTFGPHMSAEESERNYRLLMGIKDPAARAVIFGNLTPGDVLLRTHPQHTGTNVLVELDPALYDGQGVSADDVSYSDMGHCVEAELIEKYCFRAFPHSRRLRTGSGIFLFFARPDGRAHFANYVTGQEQDIPMPEVSYFYPAPPAESNQGEGEQRLQNGSMPG